MVSLRCKMVVIKALNELDIPYGIVELGEVELKQPLSSDLRQKLKVDLLNSGLGLMDDQKAILIEKIKTIIIEMVHYSDEPPNINFSHFLCEKLGGYNYTYLANLFSKTTGTTIEHFIIAHKIERVKELLLYDELNLTEISYKMDYSSVGHLSSQFKSVTGLTPTFFKNLQQHRRRIALEDL
jgi:hypothetical protein